MTSGLTDDGWSAYDDAVPHPTDLPDLVERTAALRDLRRPPDGASLTDVRQVVVVVSSSRGGSTLFGEMLRQVPGLLHLRAEINPLFTLAGLHDTVDRRRVLEEELLRDIGTPAAPNHLGTGDRARLVLDLAWRLTLQWPALAALELEQLLALVDEEVPTAESPYDPVAVQLSLIMALRRVDATVHAGYYDLPAPALEALDDSRDAPLGPPGDAIIEMPPFVTLAPWRPATATQLKSMPLVVCTPRCSFRLEFMRDLFPAADLRVVHLTRNPAASVNGLVDGWLHHGFFNSKVPGGLAIDGYSDAVPGGSEWWCYDFPCQWEQWTSATLEEVCAFQWRATHRAAMDGCDRLGINPLRLRFEDLVRPRNDTVTDSTDLARLLGVPTAEIDTVLLSDRPVVMATQPPGPARWRGRKETLTRVFGDPEVADMARRLGYHEGPSSWL